jgi:hypothetical protein
MPFRFTTATATTVASGSLRLKHAEATRELCWTGFVVVEAVEAGVLPAKLD